MCNFFFIVIFFLNFCFNSNTVCFCYDFVVCFVFLFVRISFVKSSKIALIEFIERVTIIFDFLFEAVSMFATILRFEKSAETKKQSVCCKEKNTSSKIVDALNLYSKFNVVKVDLLINVVNYCFFFVRN